jgi:hypothetical protein
MEGGGGGVFCIPAMGIPGAAGIGYQERDQCASNEQYAGGAAVIEKISQGSYDPVVEWSCDWLSGGHKRRLYIKKYNIYYFLS